MAAAPGVESLADSLPDLKATHASDTVSGSNLPRDIQDLLSTFLSAMRNIKSTSAFLSGNENNVDGIVKKLDSMVTLVRGFQEAVQSAVVNSEKELYKSHIALAVSTDVGRMVYIARTYLQPAEIERFRAYLHSKPPAVALARKLQQVQYKMKRISLDVSNISKKIREVDTERNDQNAMRIPTDVWMNWTIVDVNALLTDIENQFELVSRMIVFLQGEIYSLTSEFGRERLFSNGVDKCSDDGNGDNSDAGDMETSFQGLRLVRSCASESPSKQKNDTQYFHSAQRPHSFNSATHNAKITTFSASKKDKSWSFLRRAIRNSQRPSYSFELYEKFAGVDVLEDRLSGSEDCDVERTNRAFRQLSETYRQFKNSTRHSPHKNGGTLESNDEPICVTEFLREHQSPLSNSNFSLRNASSLGDWRHIRAYVQDNRVSEYVSNSAGAYSKDRGDAELRGDSAFSWEGYVSPLVGVIKHIDEYVARQPRTPPPPPLPLPSAPIPVAPITDTTKSSDSNQQQHERKVSFGSSTERKESFSFGKQRQRSGSGLSEHSLSELPGVAPTSSLKRSPKSTSLSEEAATAAIAVNQVEGPQSALGSQSKPASEAKSGSPKFATLASLAGMSDSLESLTKAPTGPPNADEVADIAQQMHDIYMEHVPHKASDVPKLLKKYAGREVELLERVQKKYNVQPRASQTSAAGVGATAQATTTSTPAGSTTDRLAGVSTLSGALSAEEVAPTLLGQSVSKSTGESSTSNNTLLPTTTGIGSLFGSKSAVAPSTGFGAGSNTSAPSSGIGSLFGNSTSSGAPSIAGAANSVTTSSAVDDSVGAVQKRVHDIYSQYNPSKLSEIPSLMEKYKGRELQLVANLEKKYNVPSQPLTVMPAKPASSLFGGAVPATTTASSIFGRPANSATATTTPTPFGGANSASSSNSSSIFGGAASSTAISNNTTIPSPFGTASPGGSTGGLFGGSVGVGGAVSPFANQKNQNSTSAGAGGLFGRPSGAGAATPGIGSYPVSSGFSTPLGGAAARATGSGVGSIFGSGGSSGGSLFQPSQAQPAPAGSGLNSINTMSAGFGASASSSSSGGLFGNISRPSGNSLFGGGNNAVASTPVTGFGVAPSSGGGGNSIFGGGGGVTSNNSTGAQIAHGSTGLNSIEDIHQRVRAIYTQYNPSKLAEIPGILEKYKGQELKLIANLEKKYGIDSNTGSVGATSSGGAGTGLFGGGGGLFGTPNRAPGSSSLFGSNPATSNSTGFGGGASNTTGFGGTGANTNSGFDTSMNVSIGSLGMGSGSGATSGGNSLFGRPAAVAAQPQGAFGNASASGGGLFGGLPSATQSSGVGLGAGGNRTVFGGTTVLGHGSSNNSMSGGGFCGGGGLFGGSANTNSMWGNR